MSKVQTLSERRDMIRWLRWMWFIFAILGILAIAYIVKVYGGTELDDNMAIGDLMNEIMIFLASTIIAVGGVTITGFIFFIESIRRLVDTNQIYADTVDDMKTHLLRSVIASFGACVAYAIACGFCLATVFDDKGGDHSMAVIAGILIVVYGLLLIENLYLDYRVMGYKSYLCTFAKENKKSILDGIKTIERYTIRALPEEVEALKTDGVLKKAESGSKPAMGQVFLMDGGDYIAGTGKKNNDSGRRLEWYCEISDRYGAWDSMKLYDDTERILKRIAGLDAESFDSDDYKRLESALGAKGALDSRKGMSADILDGYRLLKKYHDSMIVAGEEDGDKKTKPADELKPMLPLLSLLRFELVRKLSEKDLSGINLHGYDFSDGVLRNTILTGSKLIGSSFVQANLDCADLSKCDLSTADFKESHCKSSVFDGSKMVRVNMTDTAMTGASFAGSTIRRCLITGGDMTGCVLTEAELLSTEIREVDLSGADLRSTNFADVTAENVRFANSIFDGSRISDGTFRVCDFTGTNFGNSAINNMYFQDLALNSVRFEDADIMECIFVDCSIYDSYCTNVNFTGSVLMGADFSESRISDCDFNKAMICSYRRSEDDVKPISPKFAHSNMSGNTYTDSEIIDADFSYADMRKTRAGNTVFTRCDFTTADLTKARFRDCTFKDCKLPEGFEEMCTDCKFKPKEE